jgi:hypothetical protein
MGAGGSSAGDGKSGSTVGAGGSSSGPDHATGLDRAREKAGDKASPNARFNRDDDDDKNKNKKK